MRGLSGSAGRATILALVLVEGGLTQGADRTACRPEAQAAGSLDGQEITLADVDLQLGSRLIKIRNDEYRLRKQAFDELVAAQLLAREAARSGQSVHALVAAKNGTREAASNPAAARLALVTKLREAASVRLLLQPPRITVPVSNAMATRGPSSAPVTIVEFSDFECPYCRKLTPVLALLEGKYPGKIRRVFANFPLVRIHRSAATLAELAECAREQGRFWEAHDWMFDNPSRISSLQPQEIAAETGVNGSALEACLAAGHAANAWKRDVGLAARMGVTATPAVFINGRLVSGAQPLAVFTEIVEEELAATAAAR